MHTLHDPTKKTSINSLLNPPEAYPHTHPRVSNDPIITPNGHDSFPYEPRYNGARLCDSRDANWSPNDLGGRKMEEVVNSQYRTGHITANVVSTTNHMATNGFESRTSRNQRDQGPGRLETVSQPWRGSADLSYSGTQIGLNYLDKRSTPPDGLHHQSQSPSVNTTRPAGLTKPFALTKNCEAMSGYKTPSSATPLQYTERASVRLAAREMLPVAGRQSMGNTEHLSYYGSTSRDYATSSHGGGASGSQPRQALNQPGIASQPQTQDSYERPAKRPLPEGMDGAPPKAKRPAKAKPKSGSDGTPAVSKRGYSTKKRNEAAQLAAQNAQLVPTLPIATLSAVNCGRTTHGAIGAPTVPLLPELQFARCMSNRYKTEGFPRCVSCTRRWAGDTCRFQGIRYFLKDEHKNLVAISFGDAGDIPTLQFPETWNVPMNMSHITRSKGVIANALLPTLIQERDHLNLPELIRRTRESEVRVTCDTCMTSIFSSSWMCRLCGREACADCFALIEELTKDPPNATDTDKMERQRKRDAHAHSNPFFLACTRRNEHEASYFNPMSRFQNHELDAAIAEMERLKLEDPLPASISSVSSGIVNSRPNDPSGINSKKDSDDPPAYDLAVPVDEASGRWVEVYLKNQSKASYLPPGLAPTGLARSQYIPPNLNQSTAIVPSMEPYRYTDEEVSNFDSTTKFAKIWEHGEPLVVANISNKFSIDWTPEYFIENFGERECLITECEQDVNKKTAVRDFFSSFGKYESRTEVWKLKDWPPSSDFKTAFPNLYEDFSKAVPVPDYVRRDGVYNMGSHFPSNVVAPDLGPKMYNAWAAKQTPGSKGTTRLHMDMADAMNVMLHAANCPDGSPGCAIWDIYRAGDSNSIRSFLKVNHSLAQNYDPIHGQQYYLDDALRLKLYEKYGVKSYRIYQRPGEAIFIPAGCAHQVSNMADSIKIAIDYVSPENVHRCATLTKEFREQNKSKVWKEDVLQLKTMMWFTWQSCSKQEEKLRAASVPTTATPSTSV